MAKFRISSQPNPKPESPALMFRDLKRDPWIKYLWGHQEKLLDQYIKLTKEKDLAIELPTGSGKTLVGLLIAEYRRRALGERAVFLCPTRQLCHQVDMQAKEYGIATSLLIGRQNSYDVDLFYKYQQAKTVAITTYSGLFNTNPRINDPELIVCDDAHAADNYISSMWTLQINRKLHPMIFQLLFQELKPVIPEHMAHLMETKSDDPVHRKQVDLISAISAYDYYASIKETLSEYSEYLTKELAYPWSIISSHLDACAIYCSVDAFEIRPITPPTTTHSPFADAHQRVYMSATLGEDGDIERSFGINRIVRLPIPEGWDKRGTGRRLILFPGMSAKENADIEPELINSVLELESAKRALILVPDNTTIESIKEHLPTSCEVLESTDVESNIDIFVKAPDTTVLLIANRYDGIDLPGDDCRVLVIAGMPSGTGLQEKYMLNKLRAVSQLRDRIRTRITQALGRCTRDESDYSVVLIVGTDLLKWCCTITNVQGMHPELQAEINFGLDNSTEYNVEDMVELVNLFLSRANEWEEAEQAIQKSRQELSKMKDSVADMLQKVAHLETTYIYRSWSSRHEDAMKIAVEIADKLEGGSDLKPYRAFWYHQAAVSAFLAWKASGHEALKRSAIANLDQALSNSMGISWLARLRSRLINELETDVTVQVPLHDWFSEILGLLEEWGIKGGKFARKITTIEGYIKDTEATPFEQGLEALGRMLGAKTYRWDEAGAPDGLWIFGDWQAFVFEAKTMEKPEGGISLADIRQATTHEQHVRADKLIPDFMPCSTILITPKQKIHKTALIHAGELTYVSQEEIIKLFSSAHKALEQVRASASGNTEESLLLYSEQLYSSEHVTMMDIKNKFLKKKVSNLPVVENGSLPAKNVAKNQEVEERKKKDSLDTSAEGES